MPQDFRDESSPSHKPGRSSPDRGPSGGTPPTSDAISAWLVSKLSEELQIDPDEIDVSEPFTSYGISSVLAVSLSGDLEDWLGRPLSPTLVFDFPTIEDLARHLSGEDESQEFIEEEPLLSPREPIAIIGMACRLPGAPDVDSFWTLLRRGKCAVTEVPQNRWDASVYYDPDPSQPGKMNTRWGGFIENVDQFDAAFFGISPREAVRMDPQQRLLLEVSWEALEDAGQVLEHLHGSKTGVFIGLSTQDYLRLQIRSEEGACNDPYSGTGTAGSIASGRISYCLGLLGPNMTVDTACSSSLVALHLACQSLRLRESDLALAGGVNLILSPEGTIYFSRVRAMASDGLCKTFDASADGYVRGEGCGVVVLKRLSDAQADGDHILAVIRGSAVNHDGRSSGLTVPSVHAQQAVIQEALKSAGVHPVEVSYVEAHGTGTSLGDPIEIQALATVYGQHRKPHQPLTVASVKTNLGHLEAAAGIAGLIKVVLAFQHAEIPPHLHFKNPNPHIDWDQTSISIPAALLPWRSGEHKRIAGISSFGFSGTNAHVIVEEAPAKESSRPAASGSTGPGQFLFPLSARSMGSLRKLAGSYRDLLQGRPQAGKTWLADLCYLAGVQRTHHDYRLALVGGARNELIAALEAFLAGETTSHSFCNGIKPTNRKLRLALFLPGSREGWLEIGRDLAEGLPPFAEVLRECNEANRALTGESVLAEILLPEGVARLGGPSPSAVAVCSVQIALARLWSSWLEPDAVLGEGTGGIAARCVAGKLTMNEALKLAASLQPTQRGSQSTSQSLAQQIRELKPDVFLTLGPEQAREEELSSLSGATVFLSLFQEGTSRLAAIPHILAELYSRGFTVNWSVLQSHRTTSVRLPLYPWDRRRYWIETPRTSPVETVPSSVGETHHKESGQEWRDWIYEVVWENCPLADSGKPAAMGDWLVFTGQGEFPKAVSSLINSQGRNCIEVSSGEKYQHFDAHRYIVSATEPDDYKKLFSSLEGKQISHVLYLWGLETPHSTPGSNLAGLVRIFQSLARETRLGECKVWIITQGAMAVGQNRGRMNAAQSPLWGLGETLAVEHPNLWGGLIDLDPGMTVNDVAECVEKEILSGGFEDRVAYRAGQRYVARLDHFPVEPVEQTAPLFKKDGAYLITGGMGDVGLKVAAWLVERGAAHLILLGRTPLPARNLWSGIPGDTLEGQKISAIRQLESLGASVDTVPVDVADSEKLAAFLRGYRKESRPVIRGVFHAAGVVTAQSLLDTDPVTLNRVLTPKVTGTDNLVSLFRDEALDFMVFFSSVSALMSSPFLGSYAAANCYLDAVAHSQTAGGRHVLSVNWGFWREVGMAARFEKESGRPLAPRGMTALDPALALDALGALLVSGKAQAGVAPIDWEAWSRSHPTFATSPFFSRVAGSPAVRRSALTGQPLEPLALRGQLAVGDNAESLASLTKILTGQIASVLDMPASEVEPDQPLTSLGVDSLMAVELRNWAEIHLGVVVPVVEFLKGPSASGIAEWIHREILRQTSSVTVQTPAQSLPGPMSREEAESLLGQLDQLPEDQVDSLLASLLADKDNPQ